MITYIQNYLSHLVTYDDDDNAYYLSGNIENVLKQNELDAKKCAIDIVYILMKLNLIDFIDNYQEKKSLDDYIMELIDSLSNENMFGAWFFYYKPTRISHDIIEKNNLYDGYYDELSVHDGFYRDFNRILEKVFSVEEDLSILPMSFLVFNR